MVWDLCLLLLFAFMVFWGAYRGAVRTVLGIAALLLAGFLAVQIGNYLAPIIYQNYFSESIASAVQANLPGDGAAAGAAQQAQAAMDSLPEYIRNMAVRFGVDLNAVQAQIASYDYSGADVAQNIEGSVISPLVTAVCKVLIGIIAFLLLYVVFRLLIVLMDHFFNLPVLGAVNRILGGVLGAAKGLMVVVLVCLLAEVLVGAFCEPDSSAAQALADSRVIQWLDPYNPVRTLF